MTTTDKKRQDDELERHGVPRELRKANREALKLYGKYRDLPKELPAPDVQNFEKHYSLNKHRCVVLPNLLSVKDVNGVQVECKAVCTIVSFLEMVRTSVRMKLGRFYSQLIALTESKALRQFVEACLRSIDSSFVTLGEVYAAVKVVNELINSGYYPESDITAHFSDGIYHLALSSTFVQLFAALGVATAIESTFCSGCKFSLAELTVGVDSATLPKLEEGLPLLNEAVCPNKCGAEDCEMLTTLNPLGFIIEFEKGVLRARQGGLYDLPPEIPAQIHINGKRFTPNFVGAITCNTMESHSVVRFGGQEAVGLYNCNRPWMYFDDKIMGLARPDVQFAWFLPECEFPKGSLHKFDKTLKGFMHTQLSRLVRSLDETAPNLSPIIPILHSKLLCRLKRSFTIQDGKIVREALRMAENAESAAHDLPKL